MNLKAKSKSIVEPLINQNNYEQKANMNSENQERKMDDQQKPRHFEGGDQESDDAVMQNLSESEKQLSQISRLYLNEPQQL